MSLINGIGIGIGLNNKSVSVLQQLAATSPLMLLAGMSADNQSIVDRMGKRDGIVFETPALLGDGVGYIQFDSSLASTAFTYLDSDGIEQSDTTDADAKWIIPTGEKVGIIIFGGDTPTNKYLCQEGKGSNTNNTKLLDSVGDKPATLTSVTVADVWTTNNNIPCMLNTDGFTESDGESYYLNDNGTGLISAGVLIPALESDKTKCAAYLVDGTRAPLVNTGKVKYNASLVGSSCGKGTARIAIPNQNGEDSPFNLTSNSSMSLYFEIDKRTDADFQTILAKRDANSYQFHFRIATNRLSLLTSASVFSSQILETGKNKCAIVYNGSTGTTHFFVNGVEDVVASKAVNVKDIPVTLLSIFAETSSLACIDKIWNIRIWNAAKTWAEMSANTPDAKNLLLHYPVAAGGGSVIYSTTSQYHGTLQNTDLGTFWGETQDEYHYNMLYGHSLYEHATEPAIRVPYGLNGQPLNITPPDGYTKTADYPPVGSQGVHNNAETKLKLPVCYDLINAYSSAFTSGVANELRYDDLLDNGVNNYNDQAFIDDSEPVKKNMIVFDEIQEGQNLYNIVRSLKISWTPLSLSDLTLWLDASDSSTITSNNSNISRWGDKRENEEGHAIQENQDYQPEYDSVNESVKFSGDFMGITSTEVQAAFFVVRNANGSDSSSTLCPLIRNTGSNYVFLASPSENYTISIDGSSADTGDASINGGVLIPGDGAGENIEVPGYAPFPTQDEADIVFFQLNDTRTFTDLMKYSTKEANIDAHEIILLSSAPSKSDRQKIEGYLAHKWGIAHKLPSTHPYKFSASGIDSFVNYIYNSGIIINDGGNINDWTALANSSLSTDNSYYKLAKSGVKVASTAGGARSAVEFNLDGYDMSKLNTIIIDFYTPDSQKFGGNCQVYLSSTANYSKYHRCGHGFSANYWTGYNRITCGRSMFSNDSTGEVWGDAKQRLKIEFDSLSGQLPEFTICGVRFNFLSVPKILVQIDDGRIGDYNLARPILNNLGIKCTFGIVSDNVGTEGHMTLAQLETLASEGHLIANHSKAHTNMFGVTDHELLRTYIGDCQTYLRNNGFIVGADYLIYPNGGYNDDVIQVCQELGIKQARSTRAGYNYYPIEYPYILKNIMPTRGTTVSYLKARVDQCISECNRLDLTYHELVADPGSTYTHDPNDFEEVMEYIAETEVQCVTYDEFYDNDAHVWQSP